jgi:hypothetical protein
MNKLLIMLAASVFCTNILNAANPYLPLWEYIPDGEPYVFDDPDNPGKKRVYVYGSHDSLRGLRYCGRDQVVWSCSVDDLNKWRFDGVIFRSINDANGEPLSKNGLADVLYAPDIAVKTDANGKKTYYLFPNNTVPQRQSMVAASDRPDGPFKVINWDPKDPKKTVGDIKFDPGVFVDDDGRVYGYWGFERSYGAELDPKTMCSIKPGTKAIEDMVNGFRQPGEFRFFEASSIRKIKGKYVFVYSRWIQDGEFGLGNTPYTLAYAYSDKPLGPWTYGGTLIDARGREKRPDGSTIVTATPSGNTHGSLCEINGKWYIFYHRQSGTDDFSRQAMVAPVQVWVDERPGGAVRISEGEYNSEGFETDGLDPLSRQAAGIACYYTGPTVAISKYPRIEYSGPWNKPCYADCYDEKDPYAPHVNRCPVVHVTDGSTVGYKYFNFRKTHGKKNLALEINFIPQGKDAKVQVWVVRPNATEGGVKIGEFDISSSWPEKMRCQKISVPSLASRNAKEALFFTFSSNAKEQSLCEIEDFRFVAD